MESASDPLRSKGLRASGFRVDRSWRPPVEGSPVGRQQGLRHRRSPLREEEQRGAGVLHVEEERRSAAPGRELALTLLGSLAGLLAILAANREGQRAEALLGDLLAAFEAVAVVALLEPRQSIVDLVERLGLHLNERELDLLLDVGLRALDRVQHLVHLAAPGAFRAN